MIQPSDLGLTGKFSTWRPLQGEAFERLVASQARFPVANLPTGVGKTLVGFCYHKLLGARTVVLTSTKGLMRQYMEDLERFGLYELRGMGNYPCRALNPPLKCDIGPCLDGKECMWRHSGCTYFDREKRAAEEGIVITNYDKWLSSPNPDIWGDRDLLICDEGHDVAAKICATAGAEFTWKEVQAQEGMDGWDLATWKVWAEEKEEEATLLLEADRIDPNQRKEVRSLLNRFERLSRAREDWAFEVSEKGARFEPVNAARYAESHLFRGIPRVLIMSASIKPGDIHELGVKRVNMDFMESKSPFEPSSRPIIRVRMGFRMNSKTSYVNQCEQVRLMDIYMERRLDTGRGLIHAVSYPRAKFFKEKSRFGKYIIIHDSQALGKTVDQFLKSSGKSVLCSPSIHTGYDFADDAARWQIIPKVPFPDCRKGIAAARQEKDKHWDKKQAVKVITQMSGRLVRNMNDHGETVIMDDTIDWLYTHYLPQFQSWWREAYRLVNEDWLERC
jgi:Rad3-related DNA helicase